MSYPEPSIEAIFKQYRRKVYGLALSITRNPKDAEDALQNTFLKIARGLRFFRRQSKISTWVYRIAYNEALMILRKRRSSVRLTGYLEHAAEKAPSGLYVNWPKLPDQLLLDKELQERIDAAIQYMPIQYRTALLLHHAEGLSLKETASILQVSLSALKTRMHRAYLSLRAEIDGYRQDKEAHKYVRQKICGALMRFVYDYEKDLLSPRKKQSFNVHIDDCPSCKSFLSSYRGALRVSNALQCHDIPAPLQSRISSFLKETP
jgi:RNA polymerase sigma-70 factor (ECF subfamily)